jgi:hypothetical protein
MFWWTAARGWTCTATPWSPPVRIPVDPGGRSHRVRAAHTRTFATTTAGITALGDWLAEQRVTRAGMESTGVYWNRSTTCSKTSSRCG